MATSDKTLIEEQLEKQKVKRDVDVSQIYLANNNLEDVASLSQFENLKYLWLNGNKLRRISCLTLNFRLAELYLHDNQLVEITGALEHLTCLQVLMLQKNQLTQLEKVIHEMRKMNTLKVLNLFSNPVAQEADYRIYVIHHVPSVELLDRQEVLKSERDRGRKQYNQQQDKIEESIAFGRRSEGPPALYYPANSDFLQPTKPAEFEVGNNYYRDNPPYASEQDAVNARLRKKAVMQYSHFDWAAVPHADVKRLTGETGDESARIITLRFQ